VDYSAPFRQSIVATIANPTLAAKAFVQMFRASFSKGYMDNFFFDLENDPNYELMKELGLAITDPNSPFLKAREEAFMSGYVEKVESFIGKKLFGNENLGLVRGSERAYVYYLNKMRVDLFNQYVNRLMEQGKTPENSPEIYRTVTGYVNNVTGRGGMGKMEQYAPVLSAAFFSPRLIAARLNLLNPYYFYTLPSDVKKIYLRDMGIFLATGISILGMIYLAGGGEDEDDIWIETDPTSSDFAKIRKGNKRWDIWGGFQQYVRVIAQISRQRKKSTTTGEIIELDDNAAFGETTGDIATRFVRNKLAPIPAAIWNFKTGRTSVGEKVTVKDQLFSNLTPLLVQQMIEASQEEGVMSALSLGVPSVFGVGAEMYGERPLEMPSKIKVGYKSYELTKERQEALNVIAEAENKKIVDKTKAMKEYAEATRKVKNDMIEVAKRAAKKKATELFLDKYKKDYPEETRAERNAREDEEDAKKDMKEKITDLQ